MDSKDLNEISEAFGAMPRRYETRLREPFDLGEGDSEAFLGLETTNPGAVLNALAKANLLEGFVPRGIDNSLKGLSLTYKDTISDGDTHFYMLFEDKNCRPPEAAGHDF